MVLLIFSQVSNLIERLSFFSFSLIVPLIFQSGFQSRLKVSLIFQLGFPIILSNNLSVVNSQSAKVFAAVQLTIRLGKTNVGKSFSIYVCERVVGIAALR